MIFYKTSFAISDAVPSVAKLNDIFKIYFEMFVCSSRSLVYIALSNSIICKMKAVT